MNKYHFPLDNIDILDADVWKKKISISACRFHGTGFGQQLLNGWWPGRVLNIYEILYEYIEWLQTFVYFSVNSLYRKDSTQNIKKI